MSGLLQLITCLAKQCERRIRLQTARMGRRAWFWLGGTVLVLCTVAVALLLAARPVPNPVVQVWQDGVLAAEIPLAQLAEPYILTLEDGHGGINEIACTQEGVWMAFANCPDQLCVLRGMLRGWGYPIVCLPHRVEVRLVAGSQEPEVDAVTR